MMEAFLRSDWAFVAVLVMVMGSIADLAQCAWVVRRWLLRRREDQKRVLRRELLEELADSGKVRIGEPDGGESPPGLSH